VGAGFEGVSGRSSTLLANRWGTRGGNLLGRIANFVIPTQPLPTWYDDDEGSLYGLTGGTEGAFDQIPAIAFFSDPAPGQLPDDWQLHEISVWFPLMDTVPVLEPLAGNRYQMTCHMFTVPPQLAYGPRSVGTVGPVSTTGASTVPHRESGAS